MNIKDRISYGSRIFKKSGLPIYLIFFITSRCNAKCRHCFVERQLINRELDIEEIKKFAMSFPRLLILSLTGGEPFMREDIIEIYRAFAAKTHIITISTNGFYKDRMSRAIPRMLIDFPKTNLIVYLSIDGPETIHDKIRGHGSYLKAMDSLYMLQSLRKEFRNFNVSISMTFNNANQDYLQDTLVKFADLQLADNINIALIRGKVKDSSLKEISTDKYNEITQLKINKTIDKKKAYPNLIMNKFIQLKDYYTYKIIERILRDDRYVLPCQAGSLLAVLNDTGDVYPCEMRDSSMGNIREFDYDFVKLWHCNKAEAIRKQIKDGCYCTYECALAPSILFNPKYLTKIIYKIINRKVYKVL